MNGNRAAELKAQGRSDSELRDWFAGLAMQALVTANAYENTGSLIKRAYELADAMLAERKTAPQNEPVGTLSVAQLKDWFDVQPTNGELVRALRMGSDKGHIGQKAGDALEEGARKLFGRDTQT